MSSRDNPGIPEAICVHTVSGTADSSSRSDQLGLGPDFSHLKSSTLDQRSEDVCVFGSVAWIVRGVSVGHTKKRWKGRSAHICLGNLVESDITAVFNDRLA